jgi:hypothetical protein
MRRAVERLQIRNNLCEGIFRIFVKVKSEQIGDRAVGVSTSYGLDHRGVVFQSRLGEECSFSLSSILALRPNPPPIQWVLRVRLRGEGGKAAGA